MKQKIILTIALLTLLNLSMVMAASDFVSILNKQDDWFETPWPYGADAVAELDQVDERFNSDSVVTCNEICLYNNYKACAYSVMAYHHDNGEVTYFKFGTNLGEQLNLEHATTGADNFDKVSMFYKCTSDDSLIGDFSNIKFIGIDSLLSDDDSFQTTAEFDINGDNQVDGEESCASLGYGNCAFMYQYVENTEIDKDFFAKEVNFEIEDCSSSMNIAELDNPPSDYRNVKGMNVACLKENVGGFQGLINRIFSWFNNLFG